MWQLPYIFASGALFQAESVLTVKGKTDPSAQVVGRIMAPTGTPVCSQTVTADEAGVFSLPLSTPSASFERFRIELCSGQDTYTMEDVLFGELWLATGQSNMEMANWTMPDGYQLFRAIAGRQIRVFHVENIPQVEEGFPWEPDASTSGWWTGMDDWDKISQVSACALKFSADLYDFLNAAGNVPVGFLNASWGGTNIVDWLPRAAIDADEHMYARMKAVNTYPDQDKWNSKGVYNFQQPTCQYNVKIAPLEGVRVRGILWYQGESNCGDEYALQIYADYLRFYYRVYAERFAADLQNFRMVSSLLYPWTYGHSGECNLGYLNQAFVETAGQAPDKFLYVPISDLEPVWDFTHRYHPIHPANKYDVGARMAQLTIASVYGKDAQKSPARLIACEAADGRLRLRFDPVGTGLYVTGERARGLYIAGADGRYLPAEHTILSPDTLEIWSEAVPQPCHAAYGIQSMEVKCNLFAGDYPVTPFYTDRTQRISIEARPWYDTTVSSVWVAGAISEEAQDVFFHPVWQPLPGTELCSDTAFCRESRVSLRVCSDEDVFGCFVRSYAYNRLDLQNYAGLSVDLYNTDSLQAELMVESEEGERILPLEKTQELSYGWGRYIARFGGLPAGEIRRMIFRFRQTNTPYRFVNLERVRLL